MRITESQIRRIVRKCLNEVTFGEIWDMPGVDNVDSDDDEAAERNEGDDDGICDLCGEDMSAEYGFDNTGGVCSSCRRNNKKEAALHDKRLKIKKQY